MNHNDSSGVDNQLLKHIPANARKIFEIGCGYGHFGEQVKSLIPTVQYYAIELSSEAANVAAKKLDHVFCGDLESASLVGYDFDCIILGAMLMRLSDPLATLRHLRSMLKPDGYVLCSVPNIQHYSVVAALLSGDFPSHSTGPTANSPNNYFSYVGFIKLLLDAGFAPQIVDTLYAPPPNDLFDSLKDSLRVLKKDIEMSHYYLSAHQYIFKGSINQDYRSDRTDDALFPISFIVPTNDRQILNDNFLASPIFSKTHPHQIVLLTQQPTAAQALDVGIQHAIHDFVVYVHQDMYLPDQWDTIFCQKIRDAESRFPKAAFFGLYGAKCVNGLHRTTGCVVDRHYYREDGEPLPATVESVDEMLFGFRKNTFPGTASNLGYHLYATDIACSYRDNGYDTVVVKALSFHNCRLGKSLPQDFYISVEHLRKRWHKYVPIATACAFIS